MLGANYSLVDMAVWGWARIMPRVIGAEAADEMRNVNRLVDEINARPAVDRVQELLAAHAFKTEMDAESHRHMFPGNTRLTS